MLLGIPSPLVHKADQRIEQSANAESPRGLPATALRISGSQTGLAVKVVGGDFEDVIRESAAGSEAIVEKAIAIGIWDGADAAVREQHITSLVVNHAEVAVVLPRLVVPNSPPAIRAIAR